MGKKLRMMEASNEEREGDKGKEKNRSNEILLALILAKQHFATSCQTLAIHRDAPKYHHLFSSKN